MLTPEDLEQIRALISANNEVLFTAMRAIEEHIDRSIAQVERRLEQVERRLDRLDSRFTAFEFQLAGIGKSLTAGEKLDSEPTATQIAQQRAIDDLAKRVTNLERQMHQ
jgi:chromosome segregation ATPase